VFAEARVAYPASLSSGAPEAVRRFASEHGFPLVFKPDVGSGAVDTFVVHSAAELDETLARPLAHHLVQPFIVGNIVTFDGLCGKNRLLHVPRLRHWHHASARGPARRPLLFAARNSAELERLGRRAVSAFQIRERFFHVEFLLDPTAPTSAWK
jgi:hypothetical protein